MADTGLETRRPAQSWRWFFMLVIGTLVVRTGVVAVRYSHLAADPDAYRLIAENLVVRGVFSRTRLEAPARPTAFRPPLYPLLLAAIGWHRHIPLPAIAAAHVVLGVGTVLFTFLLAGYWRLERGRWLAALGVAFDPILLNQSAYVMTETLATFLAVVGLCVMTCWNPRRSMLHALLTGIVLGAAVLCRPTFLIWAVLIVVYVAWHRGASGNRKRRLLHAGAIALGVALVLSPWIVRNRRALHKPVVATTHGGYTLLLGNNQFFYHHLRTQPIGKVWDAQQLQAWLAKQPALTRAERAGGPAETEADRYLYQLAFQSIRRAPATFAYASLVRLGRLWTPLPHALHSRESTMRHAVRYGIGLWYLCLYAVAVAMIWRQPKKFVTWPWLSGLLLIAAFTGVHLIYWSNMRMRAPLMPVIYLVAATACATNDYRRIFSALNSRRQPEPPDARGSRTGNPPPFEPGQTT